MHTLSATRRRALPQALAALTLSLAVATGCGDSPGGPADGGSPDTPGPADGGMGGDGVSAAESQVTLAVKQVIAGQLDTLVQGAQALQAAAPAPDADGWNATADAAAVMAMKAAWRQTRDAYEHIEGAIAVLFPNYDVSTDARYDGFLQTNGPDDNLFDGMNVTGVHAIERILWSDAIPPQVVAYEMTVDGYTPAAFPATRQQADDFKNGLCQRLVDDVMAMRSDFKPLALDLASAYRGVAGSLLEQLEKISLATTGEDESRYAQRTLADMRANLAGGRTILAAFAPLIAAHGAQALADQVTTKLTSISDAYDQATTGDSLPPVPNDWNPDNITPADLATPFGKLYDLLQHETSVEDATSAVSLFNQLGDQLGIPTLR
jgi:iron uptake system component EfeO